LKSQSKLPRVCAFAGSAYAEFQVHHAELSESAPSLKALAERGRKLVNQKQPAICAGAEIKLNVRHVRPISASERLRPKRIGACE
jgi:hypothetical protein